MTDHPIKMRARGWARALGAAAIGVGLMGWAGIVLAPDVSAGGAAILGVASTGFIYFGYSMFGGYVVVSHEGLVVKEGLRLHRIPSRAVDGFQICDAKMFIAGQRTVGVSSAGAVIPLRVLAQYPTRRGLLRLEAQMRQLRKVVLEEAP